MVKEFLQSIQRRDRLGPDFFNDAEKQQWDEWLDSVPADAAHSTDAQKLLPVQMPPKCLPQLEPMVLHTDNSAAVYMSEDAASIKRSKADARGAVIRSRSKMQLKRARFE